jgi:hypothetical protein
VSFSRAGKIHDTWLGLGTKQFSKALVPHLGEVVFKVSIVLANGVCEEERHSDSE